MNLSLEEWDRLVGQHLHLIEAGAEICERHAQALIGAPEWETQAMDQLDRAERMLVEAIYRLKKARQLYKRKPHVG